MTSFRCPYCGKAYARESWYNKHDCEKKRRFEVVHSMDFRRALNLFTHWRKRNNFVRHGTTVSAKKFIEHWMYNSFTELAKFTSDNFTITSIRYLDYLIDTHTKMERWTTEETLKKYREAVRLADDPIAQVVRTHECITKWCEKKELKDPREFFTNVGPGVALQMITANQLSPWVLFGYDRSRESLLARMNDDWFATVNEYINNKYWISRIQDSEAIHQSVQMECERLFHDE